MCFGDGPQYQPLLGNVCCSIYCQVLYSTFYFAHYSDHIGVAVDNKNMQAALNTTRARPAFILGYASSRSDAQLD